MVALVRNLFTNQNNTIMDSERYKMIWAAADRAGWDALHGIQYDLDECEDGFVFITVSPHSDFCRHSGGNINPITIDLGWPVFDAKLRYANAFAEVLREHGVYDVRVRY